jgi:AhpD family alkylhydroperoxidase
MGEARIDMMAVAPGAYRALRGVEAYLQACGLDRGLIELVKMRASQINGCAFCLDMHRRDALRQGETAQRLLLLDGWRESSLYSAREQAALTRTECLTRVAAEGAPDAAYAALAAVFSAEEVANLTTLIGMINIWNRVAIGFHMQHPAAAP